MYKYLYKIMFGVLIFCSFIFRNELTVRAQEHQIYIYDYAVLLTDEEKELLTTQLKDVLPYTGNIYIFTAHESDVPLEELTSIYLDETLTERYERALYNKYCDSKEKSVVLLLDVENHKLCFEEYPKSYLPIKQDETRIDMIIENVYPYFNGASFYDCISIAFAQYEDAVKAESGFRPMKYLGNGIIAISVSVCIIYFIMRSMSVVQIQTEDERKQNIYKKVEVSNTQALKKDTTWRKISSN